MATLSTIDFLDDGSASVTWTDGETDCIAISDIPLLVADEFGLTLRVVSVKDGSCMKHVDFTPLER